MRRVACGGCGDSYLNEVLDLGNSPLAVFPASVEESKKQKRYPLMLAQCVNCSLVQLTEVVPDQELWKGDYTFYTGASWVAAEYQRACAQWVINTFPRFSRLGVLEIACNDGTLLKEIAAANLPAYGVDPAEGPATKAQEAGLNVRIDYFDRLTAQKVIEDNNGPVGVVIANNVIAHVADLEEFLTALDLVLDKKHGAAVIEFQYVVDLLLGNQFDHLYHEHRQFFSLTSLSRIVTEHNLIPLSVMQTPAQGGSLRVTLGRQGWADHSVGHLFHAERWLSEPEALAGLQGRANRIRLRLMELLVEARTKNKRVAGYGASAKGTTLYNWCGINSTHVQYAIDTTPVKQGRYVPGTDIPVISPESDSRAPDIYLLTVHSYLPQLLRQETSFLSSGGQFIVPIPQPTLL